MQKRLLDFIMFKRLIFTVIVNRSLLYQEQLHYCNIRTGHPNHVLKIQLILLIWLKSWSVSNVKQEIMQLQYTAGTYVKMQMYYALENQIHTYICLNTNAQMYIYTHTYTHSHTYRLTHIHTHAYFCMHAQTHTQLTHK